MIKQLVICGSSRSTDLCRLVVSSRSLASYFYQSCIGPKTNFISDINSQQVLHIHMIIDLVLCKFSQQRCHHSITASGATFLHPPSIWLGGIPPGLVTPQGIPASTFASFQGCFYDFAYTSSETPPLLLDPASSADSRWVQPNEIKLEFRACA